MVNVKKFSEFPAGAFDDADYQTVGLDAGANTRMPWRFEWTTAGRPTTPYNGLLGYNLDDNTYEFYDTASGDWVSLSATNILPLLASHLPGEGASLIGLEGAGTVQDLAEAGFIVKTPNVATPNAFALSTLATGILKNTTATGIPTISAPLTSIDGLTIAANQFLVTTGTNSYGTLGALTNGQLIIGSTGLAPVAASLTAGSGVSITPGAGSITISAVGSGGTVTSISAGTGITLTPDPIVGVGSVALTVPVTVPLGGTGNTTFTAFSPIFAGTTATGAFQSIGIGTLGQVLTSNGAGALASFQAIPDTGSVNAGTINQVAWYAATGNDISGLPTANNGLLITSGAGAPSISNTLGQGLAIASSVLGVGAANNIPFNNGKGIQDSNGVNQLLFNTTASAVNYFTLTNNIAGAAPIQGVAGTDTDIGQNFLNKGIGRFGFLYDSTRLVMSMTPVATGVNYIDIQNAATGNNPLISVTGTDSTIGLTVTSKSTSPVLIANNVGANSVASFSSTAGTIANYLGFVSTTTTNAPSISAIGSDTNILLQLNGKGTRGVGVQGTSTNDNAVTGNVREYISAVVDSGSPVSLVNATAKTITSISLTAGDWDVWAEFRVTGGATTTLTIMSAGISTTNNALAATPADGAAFAQVLTTAGTNWTPGGTGVPAINLAPCRASIASTTTYYLIGSCNFATSTLSGYGKICARRR